MSEQFQWTDETVLEFLQFTLKNSPVFQGRQADLEQFKESKQPKPEWEILSYQEKYRNEGITDTKEGIGEAQRHPNDYKIYSVKRLSDGQVFKLNDRINLINKDNHYYIDEFIIGKNNRMWVKNGRIEILFSDINKAEDILFTSEDGENIKEGDTIIVLSTNNWCSTSLYVAPDHLKQYGEGIKHFYSAAAKDEYILMNKPLFSINEIMELADVKDKDGITYRQYVPKYIEKAKEKLKQ